MSHDPTYAVSSALPVAVEEAFAYHERPGCLSRLIPPWESVSIEKSDDSLQVGSRVELRVHVAGIPLHWTAEHTRYEPPHRFADTQLRGPFATWDHEHRFEAAGAAESRMTDTVHYRLPGGPLGARVGGGRVRRSIEAMFAYRHRVTRDDLGLKTSHPSEPLTVAVSGAGGLIGSRLISLLSVLGHRPRRVVRSGPSGPDDIAVWESEDEAAKLAGSDVVVHLAGKPIAERRWTAEVKESIRQSRVEKTRQLCESLARLSTKPSVLICASATGFYGGRGDQWLDETSDAGDGFLPDVAQQWEQACAPARDAGIRVVNARFGLVLSPAGGALPQMLTPAKLFGGALGDGRQWWSWIALDDVLGGIYHAMTNHAVAGPVNFVAPQPVTNREFAHTLGRVIRRPALLPAPAAALRLGLGEMADALLLSSQRVQPTRLQESGYRYRFTDLAETLRYSLGYERLSSSQGESSRP